MKTLNDFDVKNKRVLVRVDFNVPLDEKGQVLDDFRLKKTLPTIKYLQEQGAKVILISHLGRPFAGAQNQKSKISPSQIFKENLGGQENQKYTLRTVALRLEELLKQEVRFLDDCRGDKIEQEIAEMQSGEIVLLENLRFYKEEEENNSEFAKALAKLADIYINDAFAVSHRAHASVVGVAKELPAGAGFLLEEEIRTLNNIIENPRRPLVVVIGGDKLETKIKLIERFLCLADYVLLGGKIANVILAGNDLCLAGPWPEPELQARIKKLNLTDTKLHLPVDGRAALKDLVNAETYVRESAVGKVRREESIFDIGPDTIKIFSDIIMGARSVFWNGPLGYIEDERFAEGTLKIAAAIIKSRAFSLVGGGETDEFLEKQGLRERFSYVSTGGGAMLEFLSGEKLPGIEALKPQS